MGTRLLYALLGSGIALVIVLIAASIFRRPFTPAFIGFAAGGASLAVGIAERRGKVKTIEEINRPVTLFPRAPVDTPGTESK